MLWGAQEATVRAAEAVCWEEEAEALQAATVCAVAEQASWGGQGL